MAELSELIAEARRRSDDVIEPPLVSDEAYAALASEAEAEACIRARLLRDDTTQGIATYPIAVGQATIALSATVDVIDSAEFRSTAGRRSNVPLKGMDWIHDQRDWSSRTNSVPCALAHVSRSQARLWPAPSVAGTLYLSVYRLPINPMEDLDDEPEIDVDHHLGLVDWMLYRVYGDKDGELYDQERASAALQAFEERFGERPSANTRRRHRERRRVTTRYCG